MNTQLRATYFLDHDSAEVRGFVQAALTDSLAEPAIALYYAVRDRIGYEVYGADLTAAGMRASSIARAGSGMCLHKSVLYAAALRAVGIPSGLVLTDVRNHLASPRLRQLAGGDVFRYHCLTSMRLGDRRLVVTPVFPRTLCRLYGFDPLEFDGTADSVHHPYDSSGRKHMEFVHTHGEFDDLPHDLVVGGLRAAHPLLFAAPTRFVTGSLVAEATSGDAH